MAPRGHAKKKQEVSYDQMGGPVTADSMGRFRSARDDAGIDLFFSATNRTNCHGMVQKIRVIRAIRG
jgi:hypothetical protein